MDLSVCKEKYRETSLFVQGWGVRQKPISDIQSVLYRCLFYHSYQMMRRCWADNPDMRPTFTKLCQELEDWIQREIPYLDMDQLNEDQPYYDASAVSLSSGSSCDGHAPGGSLHSNAAADNLACDDNEVTSESTNV